ncbi:MAG: hypothetical protein RIR11_893 [Bacteroidota bacterium]|jgi:60 kDa SS-A/Ro ribonucleoprotein
MSKLNPIVKRLFRFSDEHTAGGFGVLAARQTPIAHLRRLTLAGLLWEDNFYVDGAAAADQIATLVPQCDPDAVIDLAIECRIKQKLRHTPLFLLIQLVKTHRSARLSEAIATVCTRADMMTDLLALYEKLNGHIKPLAKTVQHGLALAMTNFDEYQLAKYDRDAKIKLRDVLRLCHPRPANEAQEALWKRVRDRSLETPDTWEVGLSAAQNDAEKKAVWERLILSNKLGALAFLRNLRNMRQVEVPASIIRKGFAQVKPSMLLPLNFVAAQRENPEFSHEIETLMLEGYNQAPKLPGKTLFIVDRSGSMSAAISGKSKFTRQDVANAMAVMAVNVCEDCHLVVTAGNDGLRTHSSTLLKYPKRGFGLLEDITKANVGGGGIFTRQVLEWAAANTLGLFDRIIVFSDSQDCDQPDKRIPKPFGKNNYIIDVSAHKHGINYKGVWTAEISGWSEHFLTYIAAMEGLENTIDNAQ